MSDSKAGKKLRSSSRSTLASDKLDKDGGSLGKRMSPVSTRLANSFSPLALGESVSPDTAADLDTNLKSSLLSILTSDPHNYSQTYN